MTPMEKYISVEGIDNAMEVARVLLKNHYQVVVELDDCNIYVVGYAQPQYGDLYFPVNDEEVEYLNFMREHKNLDYAYEAKPHNWKDATDIEEE